MHIYVKKYSEVTCNVFTCLQVRVKQSLPSPHIEDKKDVQSLVLLSKCLKIMENAAFLSSDNQVCKLQF